MTEMPKYIGKRLRDCFERAVVEPVPDSLIALMARLEARERSQRMPASSGTSHDSSKASD
jgi:hypothetical protein